MGRPTVRELDDRIEELIAAAADAMTRAYAPYSRFRVGAAILADDRIFTGQNVENASHPLAVCAERNAIGRLVDAGLGSFEAIAVVTEADRPTPPCGGCRQVLWEFGPRSTVIAGTTGGVRQRWALAELLPDAFGPRDRDA
jgi:cytidine deaminase